MAHRIIRKGICSLTALIFLIAALPVSSVEAQTTIPTIVVNGDFEAGNVSFSSDYVYAYWTTPADVLDAGEYNITTNPASVHNAFTSMGDHTTSSGRMFVANGSSDTTKVVWQGTVSQDLEIGKQYDFSVWAVNVYPSNLAILTFLVDTAVVTTQSPDGATWQRLHGTFTATSTRPVLKLINNQSAAFGNDFAIDDINIYEVGTHTPPSPGTTVSDLNLISDKSSALIGEDVTFTATIEVAEGDPTPTGTVAFYNGDIRIGTSSLNGSGIATLTTSALPQGTNEIQAEYQGDTTYAVQSNIVTVQVGSCLTPTVTSVSPNSGGLAGGTSVIITGTNFNQSGCNVTQVSFGKSTVSFSVLNATQIQATVPSGDAAGVSEGGWVNVSVAAPGGTDLLLNGYAYYGSAPLVTSFTVPALSSSLAVPVTAFTGSGDFPITGYLVTTTSTPPSAGDPLWVSSAPSTYTVSTQGIHTLYPWVKDNLGNVSTVYNSPKTVLVDTTPPSALAFTRYNPLNSPTSVTTLVFQVVFSEPVLNLNADDFLVTGGTTATISQITSLTDVSYAVSVSGGDLPVFNGTVGLDLSTGQNITDLAGNALLQNEPVVDQTYLLDHTIPTVIYGPATTPTNGSTIYGSVTQLAVQFNKDVMSGGGADAADNVNNFVLVSAGDNQMLETASCAAGPGGDDEQVTVDQAVYDSFSFTSTLDVNGGTELPAGQYELFICGTTSIYDLSGNVLNDGSDSTLSFRVAVENTSTPETIPSTGFALGQVTSLARPDAVYSPSGLSLVIPRLGVEANILGVPRSGDSWSVSWLGESVGWLQGSAFPTWLGNSVITGHIWNANNTAGPFRYIGSLKWGDRVEVEAWGSTYIYEVRSVERVAQRDVNRMLQHEEKAWLTLVTCTGYDPLSGEYQYRLLVRAVLIGIE